MPSDEAAAREHAWLLLVVQKAQGASTNQGDSDTAGCLEVALGRWERPAGLPCRTGAPALCSAQGLRQSRAGGPP